MNLDEFITKWNGKYVDTDNAYGGQCMDLMHQYCVEVLGIGDLSILAAPSAKQVYDNFQNVKGHELFEQIGNTPTGIPQEGDIMFWVNAPYGHVAIFHDGDANKFKSFDQNYPTGSPCHIQDHTYANVGGWLRFKGSNPDEKALIAQLRAELAIKDKLYEDQVQHVINQEDSINALKKTNDALTQEIQAFKKELESDSDALQGLRDTNATLTIDNTSLKSDKQKLEMDLSICKSQRKDLAKYTTIELIVEIFGRFHL